MLAHASKETFLISVEGILSEGVTTVVSQKLGEIAGASKHFGAGHRQNFHIIYKGSPPVFFSKVF